MLLVVLSGALALLAQTANGASPATRVALFDSVYGAEATYNLSMWRASLFSRLEQFISDNPALHLHHEVRAEEWHKRFEPFQPFITCPPDQRLERVGNEHDGGKWLCGLDKMKAPCNVISVGSFNDYGFEQAVLQNTKCNITTLDCTVSKPRVQDPARHKFFKKCMSSEATVTERKDFMSYRDLVEGELRLPSTDAPLLKIDIEGYEFPVMSEWTPDTPNLPSQIAVEIHVASWKRQALSKTHPIWNRHRLGVLDLGLFFAHLAELGYGIVSKEDNEYCGNCSEFTLFRVEAAVPSRATASRISQLRRHRNRRLRRARRHA
ncbi:hypothetical protein HYH03_001503 [Edaphochlamys debaryana]|uniref:Methyltransferase domain-containing protein n=1 Tax=Edaphochlamys debaryana TaxID=47281 RepID=A0A836C6B4_9CHLO|nr:hypothetical protein HYH03_001503 [Edaphochlamys debaryana]|eukprot:KAG2500739.1 hypothetical protein HYH03_001503 [Edaphochlamys debaryana]